MTSVLRPPSPVRLVPAPSEDLCLDFANTRFWRPSDQPTETLQGFGDLLTWCATAKTLDSDGVEAFRHWAQRSGRETEAIFADALALREAIYRAFSATADGALPVERDVDALNRLLERAPGRTAVTVAATGNHWRLPPVTPTAASLLAPVLWSAGDLLTGDRLARVRMCANEKCRWLFLDDSKGGTRRWCAMRACGNRAKAHRHYLRKTKLARAASGGRTGQPMRHPKGS